MPELPDLEIIREFLAARIEGVAVTSAQVRRPIVMRNLLGGDPADHLVGQRFAHVGRRGKFLLFSLENGVSMAIHAMLAGRIRYGEPLARHRVRDVLVLLLADGREVRYHDAKDMGKVYLTDDLSQIPRFATQGPEATDADLTLDVFRQRLLRRRSEIKRLLVNQTAWPAFEMPTPTRYAGVLGSTRFVVAPASPRGMLPGSTRPCTVCWQTRSRPSAHAWVIPLTCRCAIS